MEPRIITSPATPVASPITLTGLGLLHTGTYIELQFSNSSRFRSSDLVIPSAGSIKIEGSSDGKYWGLALTSSADGKIVVSIANGDYERVSIDGICDQIKLTPVIGITDATHYRVLVNCI